MALTPEWIDFVVCLLFGMFGIHKFREHRTGLGILYLLTLGLFGIGWIVDTARYLNAALIGILSFLLENPFQNLMILQKDLR